MVPYRYGDIDKIKEMCIMKKCVTVIELRVIMWEMINYGVVYLKNIDKNTTLVIILIILVMRKTGDNDANDKCE